MFGDMSFLGFCLGIRVFLLLCSSILFVRLWNEISLKRDREMKKMHKKEVGWMKKEEGIIIIKDKFFWDL